MSKQIDMTMVRSVLDTSWKSFDESDNKGSGPLEVVHFVACSCCSQDESAASDSDELDENRL